MLYLIDRPRKWQVEAVARNLRAADAQEAKAVTGLDPVTATLESWRTSQKTFGILCDRVPCGIGGVFSTHGRNFVWLVGTPLMTSPSNFREFAQESRNVFARLYHEVGMLENWVSGDNRLHCRWLQWVGCEFDPYFFHFNNTPCMRFTYVYRSSAPGRQHGDVGGIADHELRGAGLIRQGPE